MRVLYVEDNPTDADLARRILARRMPEVALELAPTLSAARFVLDRQPYPEAVLTDLRLPDGSGLELLAHIRERGLPLAVIILTGTGDQDSAVTALKSGADDYLVKRGDYLERLPRALTTALARFRTESARHGRNLQVLYVEHQAADIDLTRRHLARHAPYITLTPAGSVEEALRRLPEGPQEANPYQLVLMDYRLPGTDAFELAKLLLEERRLDLPLILITGQGSEEVAAQALRLGFADYLVKHPNYLNELPPVLEKVHIQAQLNRERTRLSETTARLNHLLTTSPTVLYALRIEGKRFLPSWISDNLPRIIGYPIEEALQPDWWIRNLHPDDHDRILADMERLFTEGRLLREYRFRHRNASYRWIRDELRLVRDDADRPVEAVGNWNDITEQRRAEEKLRLDSAAFASTRDAVLITDLEPRIVSVNRAFTKVTGYTEEEVLGRNPRLMQSGRQGPEFYRKLWQQLRQQGHWEGEIWNRRKRGEVYPQWLSISTVYDASGEPTHYVGVATDLSQLRRSEAQLDRLAHYDPLTDLPNRTLIQSQLEHLLARARRQQSRVGLLYIDLDRFKHINESMGHPVGDELLVAVAQRMQQRLRDTDILGRMSGDEFLILLESIEGPQDIAVVARDLLETMGTSFHLPGGQDIYIGASIGISLYPEDGTSADQLMRGADAALDLAKQEGRNNYRFHTESLTRAADERLRLEHRLRQALTREEFSLHYQPLVTVTDGKVVGAEALLHWHPPGEDMVPPGR
ncbi:MAG: diguanylate cyclase, partial [Candidatus Competibacterales bacterium]|nr:diguanylate cyclase [Candidatus Competibacterales bacterium]